MDLTQVSVTSIVSVIVPVLLLTYFWSCRHNPKCPPCPKFAWPIIGNVLQLSLDPRKQFANFRKQCGDIYSLYFGSNHVVILNGLDLVKEAFVKHGDDFSDRAVIFVDIASDGVNKGIASSNGAVWKEHRTFAAAVLKNFGLGRNVLALKIQEEAACFIQLLEGFHGEAIDIHPFTIISMSNIMCSIIVGQRFEYDDKLFNQVLDLIKYNLSKFKNTAALNFFPWLRFLPGDLFYCKIIANNFHKFYDIFASVYVKENEGVVGEPGNFIAAYLQEIEKNESSGKKTYLDKQNLLRTILDLFVAGTDTTAASLTWFFLYMINYPDVQEKVFQEITDVVGMERPPAIQDKAKLTYTTATIMEVQRLACLVPLSIPRVLSRDVYLRGYLLPKNSQIMANFDSILLDKSLWGDDAEVFKPERFISADGSLTSPEAWCPFSLGRRICLGESMAKMELFIFVTNIIQRFKLLPVDPKAVPPIKGHFGITHVPLPYELKFVNRVA